MGDKRNGLRGYLSRVVSGLVACAVGAVTLHDEVATVAILATVMVLVLGVMCLMLRGRAL